MKMKTSSWHTPQVSEEYSPNTTLIRAGLAGLIVGVTLYGSALYLTAMILDSEGVTDLGLSWGSCFGLAAVFVIGRGFDRIFFKQQQQ